MVYNGADDNLVYSTGWILFDRNDPARVLARAEKPIFHPIESWEKVGLVPNVIFVEELVRRGPQWLFYYGGADKYIGVAAAESHHRSHSLLVSASALCPVPLDASSRLE